LNLQGILTQRRKEAKAQGVEKEILSSKCNKPLSAECGVRSAESCGVRGHVRALERRDMSRRGKAVTCHRSPRQAAAAVVIHPCASVFIRGSFSPFFYPRMNTDETLKFSSVECADMSALWNDATCRVGGKR
jgi:hypothetical protein